MGATMASGNGGGGLLRSGVIGTPTSLALIMGGGGAMGVA